MDKQFVVHPYKTIVYNVYAILKRGDRRGGEQCAKGWGGGRSWLLKATQGTMGRDGTTLYLDHSDAHVTSHFSKLRSEHQKTHYSLC